MSNLYRVLLSIFVVCISMALLIISFWFIVAGVVIFSLYRLYRTFIAKKNKSRTWSQGSHTNAYSYKKTVEVIDMPTDHLK